MLDTKTPIDRFVAVYRGTDGPCRGMHSIAGHCN